MNPGRGGWVIMLCLLMGMVLAMVHLPETWPQWLGWFRPNWMLLVLFFWVIELPHRMGLFAAWATGVLVDVLVGDPLGLNGLILATTTYVAWRFYERLRMYSVLQQAVLIFVLVLVGEVARTFVQGLVSERPFSAGIVLIAVMSSFVWPFLYLVLMQLKTRYRVE